jgi:hypothetical protein
MRNINLFSGRIQFKFQISNFEFKRKPNSKNDDEIKGNVLNYYKVN